jgi:small GTP-binding protein
MGDGAVGKTSLRQRYLGEGFETSYHETIGADFALKYSKINIDEEQKLIKFQIWDIAGQKRYSQVRSILFDRSDGGMLLFDISNRESLDSCYDWLSTYAKYAGTGAVILVGNKDDLREDAGNNDLISKEEAEKYANKLSEEFNRPIPYLETSAKTGKNVEHAFELLAKIWFEMTAEKA